MTLQNLEIVRLHLDAWSSETPERALDYMSGDVEFDASTRPDGKVWHGHDGVREAVREWVEIWDEFHLELGEVIDAGEGRIVSLWHERGRAKRSGALMSEDGATVFRLEDGLIVSVLVSVDPEGVLAGLGLTRGRG
jgi:ketosteroid isomerase-like protein